MSYIDKEYLATQLKNLSTKIKENFATKDDVQDDLDKKQDLLIAGDHIKIVDNVISATGGGEGGGDAVDITYEDDNHPTWTNVDLALKGIIDIVEYVKPSITSFSSSPASGNFENGTTINEVTFTWATNKAITSQTLTGCTVTATDRTAKYSTPFSANKSFELKISDGKNTATSTLKYTFLNGIYYGNSTEPADYDNDFVLGLANKKLSASSTMDYAFNCAAGEYAYWAVPNGLVFDSVWVNGFSADVEKVKTITFTNSKGYTTSYSILRMTKAGLGSFTATVK